MGKQNVTVTIRLKETIQTIYSFKARFLGIINEEDRRAVLNTDKAADRLSTSPSVSLNVVNSSSVHKKYLVFVTDEMGSDNRSIFITPQVKYLRYNTSNKVLACADGKDYALEEK